MGVCPVFAGILDLHGSAARPMIQHRQPFYATESRSRQRAMPETWEEARDVGAYAFATCLTQATCPAHTIANSGNPALLPHG